MTAPSVDFPVAILVGGKGTRLREVLSDKPKPMAQVAGRPFLEWLLMYLRSLGFVRFTLCTGHMAEVVEAHFGDGSWWGADIRYSREESPLGTGGALRKAVGLMDNERFFALNGDSFCPFDPCGMARAHVQGALATLWLIRGTHSGHFGRVLLGSDGSVAGFLEKSPAGGEGLINAGVYLMERALIERHSPDQPLSLEIDVFPRMPAGTLRGVVGDGPFIDIGTPESLAAAPGFIAEHPEMFPCQTGERT